MSEDGNSFSEDDDGSLLRKALDVELPENFDPTTIPQTGEEYLHHVIYERKQCKTWVTANLDLRKFEKKQTFKIEPDSSIETPSKLLPTIDWQMKKIEDFTKLRRFLHGKINENESIIDTINDVEILKSINDKPPDFYEIIQYTQLGKMKILQLIITRIFDRNLCNTESIERNLGSWIYAILLLLEIPLSPDFCFILREFAKKCRQLRANLNGNCNEQQLLPLNLFICIIAKFYNQLDLGDC